ncbi:acyltransferase [Flavitalea sp.]|nr:acyltransferase [Flavitalea sp.]
MEPEIKQAGIINVKFGTGVKVVEPVNLYNCSIGDFSFVGPFTEIQTGVQIGKNCRIQSHSMICEGVIIGNNCFVGHGVMFVNDTFSGGSPANGNRSKWRDSRIGNNVSIGSNATILPVSICDNVVIGAGAVVTKNIDISGKYVGNPAELMPKY